MIPIYISADPCRQQASEKRVQQTFSSITVWQQLSLSAGAVYKYNVDLIKALLICSVMDSFRGSAARGRSPPFINIYIYIYIIPTIEKSIPTLEKIEFNDIDQD